MTAQLLVFAPIAASTIAWASVELGLAIRGGPATSRTSLRWLWTAGAVLAIIHSTAALALFHSWSHTEAAAATARQTAALTGLEWGGGIYFNYAFLAAWLGDAVWWWLSPRTYERRPTIVSAGVRGFLWFMFLNGAVVFADGAMRALGMLAVGAVSLAWLTRFFRQTVPAQ